MKVESALSSNLPVPWGVPQGSILGPLLFLIFLNEFPEVIKRKNGENEALENGHTVVFVDDNTPSLSDKSPVNLQKRMQESCDVIADWFTANDLTCSGEKTKLLVVGTRANRKYGLSAVIFFLRYKLAVYHCNFAE